MERQLQRRLWFYVAGARVRVDIFRYRQGRLAAGSTCKRGTSHDTSKTYATERRNPEICTSVFDRIPIDENRSDNDSPPSGIPAWISERDGD